ncbi:MAG: YedE-related selenium metabolism membrane protein [Planctomycetes bacterium]|nr:YedE-related selenium metabolism membrane protein [Planctomycetota bacterium]
MLVAAGNPGNMGICGACFLRDLAGSLGLYAKGPQVFRPEAAGLVLGAFAWMAVRGRFVARSGSHAASRFLLGVAMGLGALVFLGCPFRMAQRLGGGDLNAAVGAAGFVAGVGAALLLERRGYTVGRTAPAPAAVGLLAPFAALLLLGLFLAGGVLLGPGPGAAEGPPRAAWGMALAVGLGAGAALSATGFCLVSAARQVFGGPRPMLLAAGMLVLSYGAVLGAKGLGKWGFEGQPVAHAEHLWNFLALLLVGSAGALAGGCPVRRRVMAGEGNGDALVGVAGIAAGGALAHGLGVVSSPAGTTPAGRAVVAVGIPLVLLHGFLVARANRAGGAA